MLLGFRFGLLFYLIPAALSDFVWVFATVVDCTLFSIFVLFWLSFACFVLLLAWYT